VTATADGATRGPGAEAPDLDAVQRRVLRILVASQVLGGAGLGAGLTVGALLAEDVLDSTSLSGLPVALFTLGSAGAAMFVGSLSERRGRRAGLTAGYAAGAVGSAGVVLAAVLANPILLYASMLGVRLRDLDQPAGPLRRRRPRCRGAPRQRRQHGSWSPPRSAL
jgi:hypothetical protein